MNATTDHPRQLLLPGQAAAPDGPVDMRNMYLFHFAFRRDLDSFVSAVRSTPIDDHDTWIALAERWDFFADQLHVHHSHEDRFLWPTLQAKATPADVELLDAMEAEHDGIDPLLAGCRSGFEAMRSTPSEDERAALGVRLVAARDDLDRHLSHEERDAMAMLQRLLTPADWKAVEKQMQGDGGPRRVIGLVPWVLYGHAPGTQRELLADAELPIRLIWRLTRRRFTARERIAFRYA